MEVHSKNVISYALLPGILPRVKDLFFTGSDFLTYLVARILYVVRLLPKTHPAFRMIGKDAPQKKISLFKLMAEAANNLKINWSNSDQVIIFAALLCGIAILSLFALCLFFFAAIGTANAAGWSSTIFQTGAPEKDVAFMMLDKVFGIPGLFDSEVATNAAVYGAFPNDFQVAFHEMLGFYSIGLFIIALVIFLYHVGHIVFGITQTGHVKEHLSDDASEGGFSWLPLRYLLAIGLLLPFGMGLNSAQWITLYIAKFGSGLATNAWIAYNIEVGDNPTGEDNEHLTAIPTPPDSTGLVKKLMLMKSCRMINTWGIAFTGAADGTTGPYDVQPYIISGPNRKPLFSYGSTPGFMGGTSDYNTTPAGLAAMTTGEVFPDVLRFTNLGDIHIVMGFFQDSNPTRFKDYPGGVLPVCGEVVIPFTGLSGQSAFASEGYFYATLYAMLDVTRNGKTLDDTEVNSNLALSREYMRISSSYRDFMNEKVSSGLWTGNPDCLYDADNDGYEAFAGPGVELGKCTESVPAAYWKDLINNFYQWSFEIPTWSAYDYLAGTSKNSMSPFHRIGDSSYAVLGGINPFVLESGILERGWGGAGIWYNRVSDLTGSLYSSINSVPTIVKMPMVMQKIAAEREKTNSNEDKDYCGAYNPTKVGGSEGNTGNQNNQFAAEQATALYELCRNIFANPNIVQSSSKTTSKEINPVLGAIQSLFSQMELFNMVNNDKVAPMVQLSAIGRLLIDKAIFNLLVSFGSSAIGGVSHIAGGNGLAGADALGNAGGALAGVFGTFAVIGLSSGALLHYVVPFMPFMYFFFAVGTWVKSVFEAIVGVPLWAMTHLSRQGPGLSGSMAMSGYFLLFEILVRPIVIVFALIATYGIFSALVSGLNSVFALVVSNTMGGNVNTTSPSEMESIRGLADQFFLTIMYIIIVYMIAVGCFKLINLIPDGIMRWSGQGASSFARLDDSEGLVTQLTTQIPVAVQSEAQMFTKMGREALLDGPKAWSAQKAKERALEKAANAKKPKEMGQTSRDKVPDEGGD